MWPRKACSRPSNREHTGVTTLMTVEKSFDKVEGMSRQEPDQSLLCTFELYSSIHGQKAYRYA